MADPPGFGPELPRPKRRVLPLHYGSPAACPGFEPRMSESESEVLPLHQQAMRVPIEGFEPSVSALSAQRVYLLRQMGMAEWATSYIAVARR